MISTMMLYNKQITATYNENNFNHNKCEQGENVKRT